MKLPNIYRNKKYHYYIAIPIALMLLSLLVIFVKGIPQGIDLKGGMRITIISSTNFDVQNLKQRVNKVAPTAEVTGAANRVEILIESNSKIKVSQRNFTQIQSLSEELSKARIEELRAKSINDTDAENSAKERYNALSSKIVASSNALLKYMGSNASVASGKNAASIVKKELDKLEYNYVSDILQVVKEKNSIKEYSLEEVGQMLSAYNLRKISEAVVWALLLSSIVIFLIFRKLVPSGAVIFGAVNDIIVALGFMSLLNIPLTLASIAALLMLIGYSLDTDVMLTVKVTKRKESEPKERAYGAMKTGVMMSVTSISAFFVLLIVSLWLKIPTYFQIAVVGVLGLSADIITTWLNNAVIILWDIEKKVVKR